MDTTMKNVLSPHGRKAGLLKHRVQLTKRKGSDRYEILPIEETLSFEKGLFIFIRACQLLTQKMDDVILVGLAGPSGAGKTVFCEKLMDFMPGIAIISMDNYNDSSRLIDGNYDDPRLTDYDLLLENINGLKAGKKVEVPIYDFKLSCRVGYRCLELPPSRIVVIEGIYALSEKLRPLLDLRVAVRGGVHFDLVKRVLRDINRAGQEPEEIIQQISETVYPMYKAFIEPDLETAHIKIINKFNPFSGFQNPTYILKSAETVSEEKIRQVLSPDHAELNEETYDIYLLPPGEDPETCQSYLRMRNRDGKYSLIFEEVVTDDPFIISPRIIFEVSVRLLGGLMALGYTITTILKRTSQVFSDEKLCIKIDKLEQLQRKYVQVQGKDRKLVAEAARHLGLDGSYIPHSYIEQIQREKLISGLMGPSEDLKAKLSLHEDVLSPRLPNVLLSRSLTTENKAVCQTVYSKSLQWEQNEIKDVSFSLSHLQQEQHKYARRQMSLVVANGHCYDEKFPNSPAGYEGSTQLLEKLLSVNERLEEILSRLGDVESKLSSVPIDTPSSLQNYGSQSNILTHSVSQQNVASHLVSGNNGYGNSAAPVDSLLYEEVKDLRKGQDHLCQQLDTINIRLRDLLNAKQRKKQRKSWRYEDIFNMTALQYKTIFGLGVLTLGFIVGAKALRVYSN